MAVLGDVVVEVSANFKNFQSQIRKNLTKNLRLMEVYSRKYGDQFGSEFGSGITRGVDKGFSAAGNAARRGFSSLISIAKTASVGIAGVGIAAGIVGVKTAASMETASIAFETMLGSAQKAEKFLQSLKDFAASTPFEFPELQTAASSLISAGIEANKVIPIMGTLGDVTAGMGTGSEGIKRATVALQQMNAAGRITGEDLNQLRDAGIPVYDLLAAALGKTKGEVVELSKQGKLGQDALEKMMMALETGDGLERFNGLMEKQSQSLAGLWSALSDTVQMGLADAFQPAIPALKGVTEQAIALAEQAVPAISDFLENAFNLGPSLVDFIKAGNTGDIARTIDEIFGGTGNLIGPVETLAEAFSNILTIVTDGIIPAFQTIGSILPSWATSIGLVSGVLDVLANNAWLVQGAIVGIVSSMVAWKVATLLLNGAIAANAAITAVQTNGLKKYLFTTKLVKGSLAAWTVAQWALNGATAIFGNLIRNNPIGIIITAIAALVAVLIYAYKNSETFRKIVDGAFTSIKNTAKAVADWFKNTFLPILSKVWSSLVSGLSSAGEGIKATWAAITNAISKAWGGLTKGIDFVVAFTRGAVTNMAKVFVTMFNGIKATLGLVVAVFKASFGPPLNTARKIIEVFAVAGIRGLQKLVSWINDIFSSLWRRLVGPNGIITGPLSKAASFVAKFGADVRRFFDKLWGWIKTVFFAYWSTLYGSNGILTKPIILAVRFISSSVNKAIGLFKKLWSWVKNVFLSYWNTLYGTNGILTKPIRVALNYISKALGSIRRFFSNLIGWVKGSFTSGWNSLSSIMTKPIKSAYNAIAGPGGLLSKIRRGFYLSVQAIGKTWGKVRGAVARPIKSMADNVVNPMIDAFNSLARKVGLSKNQLNHWNFKGYRDGGFTGNIDPSKVAGFVHGKEFVMDATTTAKAGGARAMESLRKAINSGWKPTVTASVTAPARKAIGGADVPGYRSGGFVWPTNSRRLSPNYGGHSGIDVAVPTGSPLYAVASGRINYVGWGRGYGNAIFATLGGVPWVYGHGSRPLVKAGQTVKKGQLIGLSGNTGRSTGPHLHFEGALRGIFARTANRAYTLGLLSGSRVPDGASAPGEPASPWEAIKGFLGKFSSPIDWLKEKLSGPLSALNKIGSSTFAQILKKIPGIISGGLRDKIKSVVGIGGAGVQPFRLPVRGFANGVGSAVPGFSWVGERGPELMRIPRGTEILNSSQSRELADGGQNVTIVIENMSFPGVDDVETMMNIMNNLYRYAKANGRYR